ncbi:MAG: dienelactone hydrolase family protein [Ornithinimicrobium sp.]
MISPGQRPFIVPIAPEERDRIGNVDVYRPASGEPRRCPVVVFIHGGPRPQRMLPRPWDWPVYRGYGQLAASYGLVGAVVNHRLHSPTDYGRAESDIRAAVDNVRSMPDVAPDRVGLWFFSGSGLLMAPWLARPPTWLRCVAASYPVLAPLPGQDINPRYRPTEVVGRGLAIPMLLTRVGHERDVVATTVDAFVAAARARAAPLEVVDLPTAQHGFDMLEPTSAAREAVTRATNWVAQRLTNT